jgi:hypothetical protein
MDAPRPTRSRAYVPVAPKNHEGDVEAFPVHLEEKLGGAGLGSVGKNSRPSGTRHPTKAHVRLAVSRPRKRSRLYAACWNNAPAAISESLRGAQSEAPPKHTTRRSF